MPSFRRTRLAPTPSGFLHLGNILSFSVTAWLARQNGARILLRIDDLDRERAEERFIQDIFDTLRFLEIPWDEGPADALQFQKEYSQLTRLPLYRETLDKLKNGGHLFACDCSRKKIAQEGESSYPGTCSEKDIPLEQEQVSWRLHTDPKKKLWARSLSGKLMEAALPLSMKEFIVRKKDGMPAYQLSSLVDDIHFDVDLVVRGTDLWPSTCAQIYLSSLLNDIVFSQATFVHHPLLLSGEIKLSKSAGATSIQYLRKEGRKKEEIFALIAQQMNISEPVSSWEELGRVMLG